MNFPKLMKWLLLSVAMVAFTACGGSSSDKASPQEVAVAKIVKYAETDGSSSAPTVLTYKTAGVTGVTADNLDEVNAVVAGLAPEDVDTPEEIQAIVDQLGLQLPPPEIKLNGDNPMEVTQGDTFIDPGATAIDATGASVPVTATNNVDTSTVGSYTVTYTATDRAGTSATATRTVNVVAAPADADKSTVKVTVDNAVADGTATDVLEAMVLDANSNAVSGETVSFAATTDVSFSASTCTTGADGKCSITATSTKAGSYSTDVTIGGNDLSNSPVKYTFVAMVATLKTGQTKSYNENGTEVTDNSIKDDGFYQDGATPDFERNDGLNIVIDNSSGLMWQDDENVTKIRKPWLNSSNYNDCNNSTDHNSTACNDTSDDNNNTAATYC